MQQTHRTRRRFGGLATAFALGTTLALSPVVASSAPASSSLGTAPLAVAAAVPSGPVAGFEDNAARAVYWLAENSLDSLSLDAALAFIGAGYGEAVREEVLAWARTEGLAEATNAARAGKLAQIIGAYGEDIAEFTDRDLEAELREALNGGGARSIYELPFYMYGLQYTSDGVPAAAVQNLRDLQCMDETSANYGSFSWSVCGPYDMDGTSWAVQAFIGAGVPANDPAVVAAANFLRDRQIDNGAFENNVFGNIVANTNTTGLAVQAMRAVGDDKNANRGAEFISSLQAGWSPAGEVPIGLIAYDQDGYEEFEEGYVVGNEPQATVQAMLAFGGQSFADFNTDGSKSALPLGPLVHPAKYGQTKDKDALLVTHWLESAITEADGLLPNYGSADWSITLDALISLASVGTGTEAANLALDRFADEGPAYFAGNTARTAKAAYTLLVYGKDPRTFFSDRDLLADLTNARGNDGAIGATPNASGQAYALLALARTTAGVPEDAINWLADQQCVDADHENHGGYGIPWGDDANICDAVEADTTSLAIQALGGAGVPADAAEISDGLDWLVENLNETGAVEAWGEPNANSTAWAGSAFAAFDLKERGVSRDYLASQVLSTADIGRFATLTENDAGLIPVTPSDRQDAIDYGSADVMDAARFSTAQAPIGFARVGLAELTALAAATESPAPNFDDGDGSGESNSSSGTGDSDDEAPAVPQRKQPSYAG